MAGRCSDACKHPRYDPRAIPFFGEGVSYEYIDGLRNLLETGHGESVYDAVAHVVAENRELKKALRQVRDGFDHEEQTHDHRPFEYGGPCRVCLAERTLGAGE